MKDKTPISKDQAKDTGMAIVLILLILGAFTENMLFIKIALPVIIVNMVVPMAFYPAAVVWFGLSRFLGTIMSKVVLTLVFIVMVVPVGLFRRMMGKDALQLKGFKDGDDSVMTVRDHVFNSHDLEKPF